MNITTTERDEYLHESRLRAWARRAGYQLQKARTRVVESPDFGTYRVVDPFSNEVVWGGFYGTDYGLSLHEVERWLGGLR